MKTIKMILIAVTILIYGCSDDKEKMDYYDATVEVVHRSTHYQTIVDFRIVGQQWNCWNAPYTIETNSGNFTAEGWYTNIRLTPSFDFSVNGKDNISSLSVGYPYLTTQFEDFPKVYKNTTTKTFTVDKGGWLDIINMTIIEYFQEYQFIQMENPTIHTEGSESYSLEGTFNFHDFIEEKRLDEPVFDIYSTDYNIIDNDYNESEILRLVKEEINNMNK